MKQLIAEYAHLWKDRDGVYSLAQGVVYWEPPSTVNQAIAEAMQNPDDYQLHTYCPDEGLPELREALLEKLSKQNGLSNHNVMVTSGANQAYVNCVLTLLSEEDRSVVFQPYYFNHVMAIQMTRGNNALVIGSCSDQGIPDVDWLEQALEADRRIRMVTIVNPGNPTGVSLERNVLQTIVDLCGRLGVWLVLDCTYEHFDHTGANGNSHSFPGFSDGHVIHIFSFSKGHALAGYRCGYVVLSREGTLGQDAYEQMLKVRSNVMVVVRLTRKP
jgi:aspartate/methionine/tyrosine aminotransferase